MKEKVGPGAPRNTEEPQGTHRHSHMFLQLNSRTNGRSARLKITRQPPRDSSSFRAWMESSQYGEYEKSRNMINVPLAREKSTLEYRSNNVPRAVENVRVLNQV